MITDEKHHELNNLMTPIVNYFSMKQHNVPEEKKINYYNILNKEYNKIINDILPKVLEILNPNESKTVNRNENAEKFINKLNSKLKDIEPEFVDIVNEEFWNLF